MNTKTNMQDRISAFADGELPEAEIEAVLRDLETPEGRACWDAYHHAGDVMRSDDMDVPLSAGFAARMSERLASEPVILAPAAAVAVARQQGALRRFAGPTFAAAAVAALAFVVTPPVLKLLNENPAEAVVAAASQTVSHGSAMGEAAIQSDAAASLRADDLNQYLQAHQRLSPSFDSALRYDLSADVASPSAK